MIAPLHTQPRTPDRALMLHTQQAPRTADVLVCLDYGTPAGNLPMTVDELADWLRSFGATVHKVTTDTVDHFRTGEPMTRHRLTFTGLRGSSAHTLGFRAGYVVHLEYEEI